MDHQLKNASFVDSLIELNGIKVPLKFNNTDLPNATFSASIAMATFRSLCHPEEIAKTPWYLLKKTDNGWKNNGWPENKGPRKDRKPIRNDPPSITEETLNRSWSFQQMGKLTYPLQINVYPLICGG
jgi:hypothetical protein